MDDTGIITVESRTPTEFIDITDTINRLASNYTRAQVYIQSLHTTAALCLNEYERGLMLDLQRHLDRAIPTPQVPGESASKLSPLPEAFYHHDDLQVRTENLRPIERPNGWAHLRAMQFSPSLLLFAQDGRLVLGTYQRVLFLEFDGPQRRNIFYTLTPQYKDNER